ncbi:hypothetical protein FWH30_02925 [Microgenomates group bacterium]|nr:hypothetical protein [Microgenomates group bacterium]
MNQDDFINKLQSLARDQAALNRSPLLPSWLSPLGAFIFNHTFFSLIVLSSLFTFLTIFIFYA